MIPERDTFGPALKAERDRRGVTLQTIADSTKISASLLAALERNDISRWPKGIFRRAFVREYAAAVGLPPEPIVAEFVRLFPESPCTEGVETTEFRLTLEGEPSATWAESRTRAMVSLVELLAVLAVGALAAWWLDVRFWVASGFVALCYFPLANVFLERTPKPRVFGRPLGIPRRLGRAGPVNLLRTMWSKPASAKGEPLSDDAGGAATAPEWHTASN